MARKLRKSSKPFVGRCGELRVEVGKKTRAGPVMLLREGTNGEQASTDARLVWFGRCDYPSVDPNTEAEPT